MEIRNGIRIEAAKALLRVDIMSNDIFTLIGYGHYGSFYKAFRRIAGVSPRNYHHANGQHPIEVT